MKQRNRSLRRVLSMLLAVLMVFGEPGWSGLRVIAGEDIVLPGDESAPDGVTNYDLWVGGVRITSDNKDSIPNLLGTDARGEYDPETKTLTLDKVTGINGKLQDGRVVASIYSNDDLNIRGNATIETTDGSVINLNNNDDPKDLSIEGSFTFKSSGQTTVHSYGSITISGTDTVLNVTGTDTWGVTGKKGITINGGTTVVTAWGPMSTEGVFDFKAGDLTLKTNSTWSNALYVTGKDSDIKIAAGYEILTPEGGKIKMENEGTKDQIVRIVDSTDNVASEVHIGPEAEKYDIWIGGKEITSENKDKLPNLKGTGASGSYDPDKKILTLDKVTGIDGTYTPAGIEDQVLICTGSNVNITISGNAALKNTEGSVACFGGATTITGDFSFESTKNNALYCNYNILTIDGNLTAIASKNALELYGGGAGLQMKSGAMDVSGQVGIFSFGDVKFLGGEVSVDASEAAVKVLESADITVAEPLKILEPEGAEIGVKDYSKTFLKDGEFVKKLHIGTASYTVSFNMNGHGDAIGDVKVTEGNTVAEPTAPKADGWIFGGWYTSKDCKDGEQYDFTKAVTGDITLYAKWTGVERTVTFDANGKTATDMPKAQKVENGKTATLPGKEPKAEGFKFDGWYKDAAGTAEFDFSTPILADTIVYAKWVEATVDTFTVTFDLNGRPGTAPALQTVEKGKTATRPATDPIAEGYEFTDWYTEAACTNKYNFDTPVNEDIIIYAGWKEIAVSENKISALDPRPFIDETTKELYLVKGQKFTLDSSWIVDNSDKNKYKAYKKLISISKKGKVSAKKPGDAVIIKKDTEGNVVQTISVNICKPELNKKTLKLEAGEKANVGLSGYGDLGVYYYCASPDVATVAPDGTITAVAKGTAKVTAYVNGKAYTRSIKVKESTVASSRTIHMNVNTSKTISIKGVTNKTVWTTTSENVAQVVKKKITSKEAGTAKLSASVNGGDIFIDVISEDLTMNGTGMEPAKGTNKYTLTLNAGQSSEIAFASVDQPVVFKSSKPEIAFIDENGHIEARSSGKAKFTTKVNGKSITITVTIK